MEPSASQNRINEGTQLVGDIQSSGFFRIDGSIEGNISNPSKVVLGKSGIIKGKLECDDADIEVAAGKDQVTQLVKERDIGRAYRCYQGGDGHDEGGEVAIVGTPDV